MQLSFRLYATVELVYIVYSIQLEKADSVQFPAAKSSECTIFSCKRPSKKCLGGNFHCYNPAPAAKATT